MTQRRAGSFAEPLTQDVSPLGVIIPHAQVLLEITFGITETVLSFGGQHFTSMQFKVDLGSPTKH